MWDNAETVCVVDDEGVIRAISRNEKEDPIKEGVGSSILYRVTPESLPEAEAALKAAQAGEQRELLVAAEADAGYLFWSRVMVRPHPENRSWVLVHSRRLPRPWNRLSRREREVVAALQHCGMNPKRAARTLGVSTNTLSAHRRSISGKCGLLGPGDFWVFVEQCR